MGFFNAKTILVEKQWLYYLAHIWEDGGVHTFPKGISPKVNVIVQLEFELAYYDVAVQHVSHYAMGLAFHLSVWHLKRLINIYFATGLLVLSNKTI